MRDDSVQPRMCSTAKPAKVRKSFAPEKSGAARTPPESGDARVEVSPARPLFAACRLGREDCLLLRSDRQAREDIRHVSPRLLGQLLERLGALLLGRLVAGLPGELLAFAQQTAGVVSPAEMRVNLAEKQ